MLHKHVALLLGTASPIAVMLFLTNPEKLPVAAFVALFILLYGLLYAALALCGFLLRYAGLLPWSSRRICQTAAVVTCLPVFFLILQSIGQLTIKDVMLATGLFILLYLYFGRLLIKSPTDQ